MKQCREGCVHAEACRRFADNGTYWNSGDCPVFKKQSENAIELPCKVGETVYSLVPEILQVLTGEVYEIFIGRYGIFFRATRKGYYTCGFTQKDIGKTVFFSRSEAEKALAKMKGGE